MVAAEKPTNLRFRNVKLLAQCSLAPSKFPQPIQDDFRETHAQLVTVAVGGLPVLFSQLAQTTQAHDLFSQSPSFLTLATSSM